jgi:hypothetical protein
VTSTDVENNSEEKKQIFREGINLHYTRADILNYTKYWLIQCKRSTGRQRMRWQRNRTRNYHNFKTLICRVDASLNAPPTINNTNWTKHRNIYVKCVVHLTAKRWLHKGLENVTVKLSLYLINYTLCHEEIWRSGGIAPPILTSPLDGGERSTSRLGHFTRGVRALGTHWIGCWEGRRAGLDAVEYRKISCPWRKSKRVPGNHWIGGWVGLRATKGQLSHNALNLY